MFLTMSSKYNLFPPWNFEEHPIGKFWIRGTLNTFCKYSPRLVDYLFIAPLCAYIWLVSQMSCVKIPHQWIDKILTVQCTVYIPNLLSSETAAKVTDQRGKKTLSSSTPFKGEHFQGRGFGLQKNTPRETVPLSLILVSW